MSYLSLTPSVPLFVLRLIGVETEGLLDYQGGQGSLPVPNFYPVGRGKRPDMPEKQAIPVDPRDVRDTDWRALRGALCL